MTRYNAKLTQLYKKSPLKYRLCTLIRNAICPFDEIEKYVPRQGRIVDLGCCHGMFVNILAMKSALRHVVGIDIIEDKIKVAHAASAGVGNVEFKIADVQQGLEDREVDCFTLVDILSYLPFEKKKELLKNMYKCLQPGGLVIIKSMHKSPKWKYLWTLFHMFTIDKIMQTSLNKNTHFMKKEDYLSLFRSVGFETAFKRVDKGYPYPHCLYICKKP